MALHRTLARQIKRLLGVDEADLPELAQAFGDLARQENLDPATVTALQGLEKFIQRIDESYAQNDRDLDLRSRSLELSSNELTRSNMILTQELASRERSIGMLHEATQRLMAGTEWEWPPGPDDQLEAVAHAHGFPGQ
jgi:two-component system sensor histidine kinase/response regulator